MIVLNDHVKNNMEKMKKFIDNLSVSIDSLQTSLITIYVKSFERENFHGFHGFLLTVNVLPLKIFIEYQHCPITTQSMVPPGLKFSTVKVFLTY